MKSRHDTSLTSQRKLTLDDLYKALRREIETRDLRGPKLERESDEETGAEWLTYSYSTEEDSGLDFMIWVNDDMQYFVGIGPVQNDANMASAKLTAQEWAVQLADIAQMVLNGQFTLVLTLREKDDEWQAGELVWIDEHGKQMTMMTLSHHEYFKTPLRAIVLQNNDNYPLVHLPIHHTMHPEKVNGKYVQGRTIDIHNPTPLTKAKFNELQDSLPVQLIGGEKDEPIWEVFYRRTEFWLITFAVAAPLTWVLFTYVDGDEWWKIIARPIIGLIGMLLITFLSTFVLARRQMRLDAGKRPLFEPFEQSISWQYASACMALCIAASWFVQPIWTTKAEPSKLQTAFEQPITLLWLAAAAGFLFVAMVVLRPTSWRNKIGRMITMLLSFSLFAHTNFSILYGGEGAAEASWYATLMTLIMPLVILVWYVADCFRKPKCETKPSGPLAPWLLPLIGWVMVTGGLAWSIYVVLPRLIGTQTMTTAVSYTASKEQSGDQVYHAEYEYMANGKHHKKQTEVEKTVFDRKPKEFPVWYLPFHTDSSFAIVQTPWKAGIGVVSNVIGLAAVWQARLQAKRRKAAKE